jgi:hypothetical protein
MNDENLNNEYNSDEYDINNIVAGFVEVSLDHPDDFLKIKESLTRIGILSLKTNVLFQSCHILHKRGRYYIVSFKELFLLDGKESTLSENDIARRNTIARLLEQWGLLKIVSKNLTLFEPVCNIKIVTFKDKDNYNLRAKYTIGIKH